MFNFTKLAASAIMLSVAFGASAVSHLNIIGGATPGGWGIFDGILMPPTADDENVFSCVAYLKADQEFKFTCGTNFEDPNKEYRNASADAYTIEKLVQGGDDNKFMVRESANYKIVCNLNEMTISVTKAEYQENPVRFNALYMIGSATAGAWSIPAGTALNWGGENEPFKFTWSGDMKVGEFKIDSNIYNDSWSGPWFYAGANGEGNIDYSKISSDGTNDRKWQIAEAGAYNINIDLLKGSISITKGSQSGIEEIVDENAETPVYYNLQGVVVTNPRNGVYVKKVGNKVTKVMF